MISILPAHLAEAIQYRNLDKNQRIEEIEMSLFQRVVMLENRSLLTRHMINDGLKGFLYMFYLRFRANVGHFNCDDIKLNRLLVFVIAMHIKLCNVSDLRLLAVIY